MKPFVLLLFFVLLSWNKSLAQSCENQALSFDGNGDYIFLNTSGTSVSGNANFTAEAWFFANPPGGGVGLNNLRRLIVLSGNNPFSTFELGVGNGGLLYINYADASGNTTLFPILVSATNVVNAWHHVAVSRNTSSIQVYLDCVPVYTLANPGSFNFDEFLIGHVNGGAPTEDWDGQVDEIRLWDTVRTPTEICDTKDCSLSGTSPGLVANWPLNQGTVPGGPNPGAMAKDSSGNGNDGTLNGFNLANVDSLSNFVCNTCPPRFELSITDNPSLTPTLLTAICSGNAVHFCVTQNFAPVTIPGGATVVWQYDDGGQGQWTNVNSPVFTGFCFGVPLGEIDIGSICATSTTGYVDRSYRAVITRTTGSQTCTYTTSEHLLRIYCPITNAGIVLNTQPPVPLNGALCEDTVTVNVSISSTDSFMTLPAVPPVGDLSIEWCIDGVHDPAYDNLASFIYKDSAFFPELCFEAKIQNGSCPVLKTETCIAVDSQPMCGLIDAMSASLMPDLLGGQYDYLICPGDDGVIGMVNPADFKGCNAVWQYNLNTDPAGVWHDLLGVGNPTQNTNTLPHLKPAGSPYLWSPSDTCIYYRIECRPFHYPNSACSPCHSNEVRICLKQPLPADTIVGSTQICFGGVATLYVGIYNPTYTYTWFCNGLQTGTGYPFLATQNGCYWVEIFDGCFKIVTPKHCLEVCEIIPIITCPLPPNPCACEGEPIFLSGCASTDNCAGTLSYAWTASNGPPLILHPPCDIEHIPDVNGTTYTLTVTNTLTGCSAVTSTFIKPCKKL